MFPDATPEEPEATVVSEEAEPTNKLTSDISLEDIIPDTLSSGIKPEVNIIGNKLAIGKPRKSKRMKLHKSKLESIEEDESEIMLNRFVRSGDSLNRLPLQSSLVATSRGSVDYANYQEVQQSLDERRRDVALLRKISNSSNNTRQSSQLTMQALARKKLRRLPAISNDTTNLAENATATVQ